MSLRSQERLGRFVGLPTRCNDNYLINSETTSIPTCAYGRYAGLWE